MKKQIKITVRTDSDGDWAACGWSGEVSNNFCPPEELLRDLINIEYLEHVVIAEVEFPDAPIVAVVPGTVISSEEKHD